MNVPRGFESPLSPPDTCTHSSAGRAPLLQSRGPWFDPKCVYQSCDVSSVGTERRFAMPEVEGSTPSRRTIHLKHAALAQRIRVPGFDPGGRGFKSCTPHQSRRPLIAIVTVHRRVPIEAEWRCLESRWSIIDTKVRILHPPPHIRSHRLAGEDISLSRRRLGFESQ